MLGIAIRADVPLPLDLLPSFWKTLVGEPLDPDGDLQEADILTYNYVKKFESVSGKSFILRDSRNSVPRTLIATFMAWGTRAPQLKTGWDLPGSMRECKPFLPARFASWGQKPLASLPADSSRLGVTCQCLRPGRGCSPAGRHLKEVIG